MSKFFVTKTNAKIYIDFKQDKFQVKKNDMLMETKPPL